MKKNEKKFNNNSGLSSRKIAVEILLEIIESLVPLDDVFNKFIKQGSSLSKMQPEDRSFCRLLVSSTLRNLTEIDYILNKFLKKSLDKSPPKVQMILRIGIVQIVYLRTPDHAATNTSVELGGNKWKSLINAIMRNVLRGRDKINAYQSESDVQSLVKLQSELLLSTWKFLANGGSLIYCTCSLEKEEGENQIFKFINENKDAKIDKIKPEEVIELKELITKEGLLRIFPNHLKEIGGMDGFFIARLKKVS